MSSLKLWVFLAFLAAPFALVAGLVSAEDKNITIDGSSTVYPITEAVVEAFHKATKDKIRVTVGISGTGGGFKKFTQGKTDISNASRPILAKEMAEAKKNGISYIELPVAFDAVTVVVNPGNNWAGTLAMDELKKMWEPEAQGKITNWNQIRPGFPDAPLKLFGPGADSGTFDFFTEAVVGKAKSSRKDYTSSEDDTLLVQGISGNKNALGYFGFAYYDENKDRLKAVAIIAGMGKAVFPSAETVIDGTYPLSRPLFIYVNKKSLERAEVQEFVEFYLKNAERLAKEVKYVPLPAEAYTAALERFRAGRTGTVFGGKPEVGMTIKEVLKRELKE